MKRYGLLNAGAAIGVLLVMMLLLQVSAYAQDNELDCHACANEFSSEGNGREAPIDFDAAVNNVWSSRIRAGFGFLKSIDAKVTRKFERAWYFSNAGTNGREGLVLVLRERDDTYRVESFGFTGEYQKVTFKWDRSIIAIVHTHPNDVDPRPSKHDQRVAEKYDVPVFTITSRGMYAYDPDTKITIQVLKGLDWACPSKWTPDVYRKLITGFLDGSARRPSDSPTGVGAAGK